MREKNTLNSVEFFLPAALVLALMTLTPASLVHAFVTGNCANCHTMHNSQEGASLVHAAAGAGWSSGQLTGGSETTAQENLLVSDCVGCHSNTGDQTIVNLGSTKIPIVYNMTEPDGSSISNTPLAGGNFHWVASDDAKGHNVYGISSVDGALNYPPGKPSAGCQPCHINLITPEGAAFSGKIAKGGCQACHVPRHHADGSNTVVGQTDGWYRFLGSAMQAASTGSNDVTRGVVGIEDDDWEQTRSETDHNVYQGTSTLYLSAGMGSGLSNGSIGQLCIGCHARFHHGSGNTMNTDNTAWVDSTELTGAWIRHPSDVLIEDKGEYSNLTTYSVVAPVARKDLVATDADFQTIDHNRDVVTCISCHRPHGSPHADMLRWDYSTMLAHDSNADAGNGCFVCHTAKDDL